MKGALARLLIWRAGRPLTNRLLAAHWTSGGTRLRGWRREWFRIASEALDQEYYAEGTGTRQREALKAVCMARASAVEWAKSYLARGFPEAQTPVIAMFEGIERALASGQIGSMHQVGCCSAREIGYYAGRYPKVEFVGSDCDESLIEFLREHWKTRENLRFEVLRMETPPEEFACDLLVASGGLHYLDPAALGSFLAWARPRVQRFYLSQPLDRGFDPMGERSTGRGMLSWNHPYSRRLLEAGFAVVGWKPGYLPHLPQFENYSGFAAKEREDFWPDQVTVEESVAAR